MWRFPRHTVIIHNMEIYLVTRNTGKLMAAQHSFDGTGITLLPVGKDYPEIQADSSREIAHYTALAVARELGKPAVREDHSLFLNAWGIPGPFMNYFEKKIPATKLLTMLSGESDRTGYFEVATALAKPSGEIQEFSFRVPFSIATEERGTLQSGWNRIIVLEGEARTLAEYPETERLHIWSQNYDKIAVSFGAKWSGIRNAVP